MFMGQLLVGKNTNNTKSVPVFEDIIVNSKRIDLIRTFPWYMYLMGLNDRSLLRRVMGSRGHPVVL